MYDLHVAGAAPPVVTPPAGVCFLTRRQCKEPVKPPRTPTLLATLTSKGQITLPKEIRDRLGLDAGSMLDFQLLADNTITARAITPDARRLRGLLKSPRAAPLTVEQMDEGIARHLAEKYALPARRRSPTGR